MKIYIVERMLDWDDYTEIKKVFLKEEDAKKYCKEHYKESLKNSKGEKMVQWVYSAWKVD